MSDHIDEAVHDRSEARCDVTDGMVGSWLPEDIWDAWAIEGEYSGDPLLDGRDSGVMLGPDERPF